MQGALCLGMLLVPALALAASPDPAALARQLDRQARVDEKPCAPADQTETETLRAGGVAEEQLPCRRDDHL